MTYEDNITDDQVAGSSYLLSYQGFFFFFFLTKDQSQKSKRVGPSHAGSGIVSWFPAAEIQQVGLRRSESQSMEGHRNYGVKEEFLAAGTTGDRGSTNPSEVENIWGFHINQSWRRKGWFWIMVGDNRMERRGTIYKNRKLITKGEDSQQAMPQVIGELWYHQ